MKRIWRTKNGKEIKVKDMTTDIFVIALNVLKKEE